MYLYVSTTHVYGSVKDSAVRYCRAPIDVYIVTNQHFFFFFRQLNKSLIIILDHVGHNRQPMHNAICITRRKCDIIVVIIK